MRVREPLAFSIEHVGRGGNLLCQCAAGEVRLALVRTWLDANGRAS
ncbi:MAG TPA: hypothetical protein VI197_26905 [Polyangiaceae bacterium]